MTAGLLAGAAANAVANDQQFLLTQQDTSVRSFFTLDFGPFGQTEGEVTETRFLFLLDWTENTAEFLKYSQHIDSLTLPGGFETGAITVMVVPGTSAGTIDPNTGEFETQEDYLIFFEGDLTKFGITSPLTLPSTSRGTITFDNPRNGGVAQRWEGAGQLQNPFDPNSMIDFSYTCEVGSDHQQVDRGDLNCDGAVDAFDIEPFLQAMNEPNVYDENFEVCDKTLGDFDQSGVVNPFDIEAFLDAMFGK